MKKVNRYFKYGMAATDAVLGNEYSWGIARSYLQKEENRAKGLNPDLLEKQIRIQQDAVSYMALGAAVLVLAKPLKFLVKRKLRKRKNRAK